MTQLPELVQKAYEEFGMSVTGIGARIGKIKLLDQDDGSHNVFVPFDEYLEGVRDVERRIQRAEQRQSYDLPEVAQPEGIPATFAEHVRLMFDLQLLAHQIDLTRVSTFML